MEKKFLYQDHSGRGISSVLDEDHIRQHFDLTYTEDEGETFAQTLGDWLESCEVGDTWLNHEEYYSITRCE